MCHIDPSFVGQLSREWSRRVNRNRAYGPIVFYNKDSSVSMILDWDFVTKQAAGEKVDPNFSVAKNAA